MRKLTLASILAILPLAALAQDTTLAVGADLGMSEQAVKDSLTAMGYEVRKTDMEDGEIEAYAVKGKEMAEIYVSPETGKITKIKAED